MVEKKTYSMVRVCLNCNYKHHIEVPFGETVPMTEEGVTCPYCGCDFWSSAFRPDDPRVK